MSLLLFLLPLAVLLAEGTLAARVLLPGEAKVLHAALALPLASLGNALLFFLCTVTGIPLSPLPLALLHGAVIALLATAAWRARPPSVPAPPPVFPMGRAGKAAAFLCAAVLGLIALYASVHAVVLHSFSIDSLTNWTMRSQISWADGRMAFDADESRGMAKPQYPFLLHGLQILANQGQAAWNDRAANAVTLLLTLSAFGGGFLLLRARRGAPHALVTVTLALGIPLLAVHTAQGYGDIHLIGYLLLSFLALVSGRETGERKWLWLSALCMAGAMWTKLEGLYFGWLPWAALLLLTAAPAHGRMRTAGIAALPLVLFLPFIGLLLAKGLALTPHGTDTSFAWQPQGIPLMAAELWGSGSFGMFWYLFPFVLAGILLAWRRGSDSVDRRHVVLFGWGLFVVLELLVIYLCTPNAAYLANQEAFSRQALSAAVLLLLAAAVMLRGAERR